jgi:predicted DNA-binding transcriptional regulator AlpA
MTGETITDRPMLSSRKLAAKWGCCLQTARKRTRSEGFPQAVGLGPRSMRWYLDEVLVWEETLR